MLKHITKWFFLLSFEQSFHTSTQIPLIQLRFFQYLLFANGKKVTIFLLWSGILFATCVIRRQEFSMDVSVLSPGESLDL